MHIALVCRWYPPHTGFGGVAMHVYYLARALVEKEHRVTVIAARWSPDVPTREEADGIRVIRLLVKHRSWMHRLPLAGRHMRSIVQAGYSFRVMRALGELEKSDPPDVVEFADVEAEGYCYLRRRKRCPVVVRCHTPMFVLRQYYQPEEVPWSLRGIEAREKYCIAHADALTAPSRHMARTIATTCGLPQAGIAVIPNALDIAPFEQAEREADACGTAADEVVVLHVGRLDRGKGIDVLADAIPPVLKEIPYVRFVFIGDDCPDGDGTTWQARLQAKFQAHGVSDRVTFLGALGQHEMVAWYGRADIAVVPSLIYESFSYTCAQAAAAALPVVASRIGGIPETIEDGVAGLIVEPGSVEQLASAIIRLARDPALRRRMGHAGQKNTFSEFSAPMVAERVSQLYRSVMERSIAQDLTPSRTCASWAPKARYNDPGAALLLDNKDCSHLGLRTATWDEWDAAYASATERHFFLSPHWGRAVAATYGLRPYIFALAFPAQEVLLPSFLTRRVRGVFLGLRSMPPYHYGGLLSRKPLSREQSCALGRRLSELWRLHTLYVSSSPRGPIPGWEDYQATTFTTHILDLSGGFEGVWRRAFGSEQRNRLRKAERSSLVIRKDNSPAAVERFFHLYKLSCQRWKLSKPEPRQFFTTLLHPSSQPVNLWLASKDGQDIAGIVVADNNLDTAYYLAGASDANYWSYCPNNLLFCRAIEDACSRGFKQFDFLPSGRLPKVAAFKESFGARPVSVPEYRMNGRLPHMKARGLRVWSEHLSLRAK